MLARYDITAPAQAGNNRILLHTRNLMKKILPTRHVTVFCAQGELQGLTWRMSGDVHGTLDMSRLDWRPLDPAAVPAGQPAFFRAGFTLDMPSALSIRFDGLSQGYIVLNGRNLGRFYDIGPQRALFAPHCWTRAGDNDIIVFDERGQVPCDVKIERLGVYSA